MHNLDLDTTLPSAQPKICMGGRTQRIAHNEERNLLLFGALQHLFAAALHELPVCLQNLL